MEEHLETEPESKLRKYLTYILSIILIILIITLVFSQGGFFEQFTANKIENNKVNFKDKIIEFEDNTYDQLIKIYLENQPNEIKVCLMGEINNNDITITKIIEPGIIHQEFSKVISSPCPEETIISMHSHPRKSCIFSEQDIKTFNQQNIPMMGLLCDDNRMNFYS